MPKGRPSRAALFSWRRGMYRDRVRLLIILLALLPVACREQRPPAPTAEQSAQLNDAEDMLNSMSSNEEGPEANASSPSNSSD